MATPPLLFSPGQSTLLRAGARFDPRRLTWIPGQEKPTDARAIAPEEAARWVLVDQRAPAPPVGVIGPRDADAGIRANAENLGRRLAEIGFPMICGGRTGAMEAVCKGFSEAGGRPIGILPGDDWAHANPYVGVPLATGVGEARNAIIASASFALVAVGGGYGTLSEIALGLRLRRLVVTLPDAHAVDGAIACANVDDAVARVVDRLLGLDGVGPAHVRD